MSTARIVGILSVAAALVVFYFFGGYTHFSCEKNPGVCKLAHINIFGIRSKKIDIDDIVSISTQRSKKAYRLRWVVKTPSVKIPFTKFYTGPGFAQKFLGKEHKVTRQVRKINQFLNSEETSIKISELHIIGNISGMILLIFGIFCFFGKIESR
jgi:hypothetical protein